MPGVAPAVFIKSLDLHTSRQFPDSRRIDTLSFQPALQDCRIESFAQIHTASEVAEAFRVEGDFARPLKDVGGHDRVADDLASDELFIETPKAGFKILSIQNGLAS